MVRRAIGAFYLLSFLRMDANKVVRGVKAAYEKEPFKQYRRTKPFQLGWWFDVTMLALMLLAITAYISG